MTLIRMISLVCFLVVFGNKAVAQDTPDIIGNNVNLYYHNYDEAEHFYSYILGFKSVHEINGYSKTFQISPTTFITLIHDDGTGRARHSADEPKTVAIALLTDHVQEWYDYAVEQKLKIRAPLKPLGDKNYQSFFVTDPGGYYLEFEYLADHPENTVLFPLLEKSEHIYPDKEQETSRPDTLGIKASVYWLYHKDRMRTADFYQNVMGLKRLVVQSFADIYTSSRTGYIGLVTSGKGSSIFATDQKAIDVGFITSDAQTWFEFLKTQPSFKLETEKLSDEIVIGTDPENYSIEIIELYYASNPTKISVEK